MGFLRRIRRFLSNLVPAFLAGGFFLLAAGRLAHDPSAGRLGLLLAGGLYGVGVVGLIRLFPIAPWAYFVAGFLCGPIPAALLVGRSMGEEDRAGFWLLTALLGLLVGLLETARVHLRRGSEGEAEPGP